MSEKTFQAIDSEAKVNSDGLSKDQTFIPHIDRIPCCLLEVLQLNFLSLN